MNKIHRTVWSETRQAYVVTHEKAVTHGKPSTTRKAIVSAVAAALVALSGEALAVSSCGTPGTTVVSGAETDQCNLINGESLSVTGGIVNGAFGGTGVNVGAGVSTAGSIHNNGGTISAFGGVAIAGASAILSGGLTNSGTISGMVGIFVDAGGGAARWPYQFGGNLREQCWHWPERRFDVVGKSYQRVDSHHYCLWRWGERRRHRPQVKQPPDGQRAQRRYDCRRALGVLCAQQ